MIDQYTPVTLAGASFVTIIASHKRIYLFFFVKSKPFFERGKKTINSSINKDDFITQLRKIYPIS